MPFSVLLACLLSLAPCATESAAEWKTLEPGLDLGVFDAPLKARSGDSKITVLRVDTVHFSLALLCAARLDSVNLTARQWCDRHDLAAAVNAGMYATDYSTHIGYMKNFAYVNNSSLRRDYKAVLAFNPVRGASVPPVRIIDLGCQDFTALKKKYNTFVQNLRMVDCGGKNVWGPGGRAVSCAALAIDKKGNVLFIFAQSAFIVRDFVDAILQLPLAVQSAMYLEGGGPASLYARSGNAVVERYGVSENGNPQAGSLSFAHALPNVIGVVRKK